MRRACPAYPALPGLRAPAASHMPRYAIRSSRSSSPGRKPWRPHSPGRCICSPATPPSSTGSTPRSTPCWKAGTPAWDDLPRLELTRRIIAETLRLYPSGGLFSRTVTTNTRLGGHPLPAGTPVLVSPYLIHHRPDVYPDPSAFDPDRWPAANGGRTRGTYLPFGAGARVCIGERFALTEAVLALAAIAGRWHLHPVPSSRVRVPGIVVVRPSGLRMRVRPRTASAGTVS